VSAPAALPPLETYEAFWPAVPGKPDKREIGQRSKDQCPVPDIDKITMFCAE
jgi:hypothetical protein